MLIGLLTIWLLGGGASSSMTAGYVDQIGKYASSQIADKDRRNAVLDTARELERAGREEAKATADAGRVLVKIAQDRGAKPQDLEAVLSQARGHTIELQDKLLQQRSRLKTQLTREQWIAMHAGT